MPGWDFSCLWSFVDFNFYATRHSIFAAIYWSHIKTKTKNRFLLFHLNLTKMWSKRLIVIIKHWLLFTLTLAVRLPHCSLVRFCQHFLKCFSIKLVTKLRYLKVKENMNLPTKLKRYGFSILELPIQPNFLLNDNLYQAINNWMLSDCAEIASDMVINALRFVAFALSLPYNIQNG